MNKLVSIIMPTYNSSEFIGDSVESVINQTYKNWELLIVDDCSTDNTYDIISNFSTDCRIKYYRLDSNSGTAIARNFAIDKARGDYIAFLDSDDIWFENKLEIQLDFMSKNNYDISCTSYNQIDECGKELEKKFTPPNKISYNRILLDCPIGNSTVIYDVVKLGKIYVPEIRKRNDDALWLKILKKTDFIFGLQEVTTSYRIRKNSISSNKFSLVKYHWILYRKIEKLSILRSLFHIFIWGLIKIFKIK